MKQRWQAWERIANGITGISIPIFGVSWNPPTLQRTAAERAITYLESRGLLYAEFQWENPDQCYEDASGVRDDLTRQMERLTRDSPVFLQLDAIRNACRVFRDLLRQKNLEKFSHHSELSDKQKSDFFQALGALRDACGKQIMILVVEYGIDIAPHLAACLPTPPAAE